MSTDIDLRQPLFSSACPLTDEEKSFPDLLQHHLDDDVQALAVKSWHRVLHNDLDPQKLRPFLSFRPVEIMHKTLFNTTQLARMITHHPLWKHLKPRFPFLNS